MKKDKKTILYELLNTATKKKVERELYKIVIEIDYEFIPPLSYRDSTTFKFDSKSKKTVLPDLYFEKLLKQEIMVSRKKVNKSITGFMSFIPNHVIETNDLRMKCYYITTIGVTKGERGNGITKQFYKRIEEEILKQKTSTHVATRTWSTNRTHIRILESIGYELIIQLKDDRGPGIHTVYYAKEISKARLN